MCFSEDTETQPIKQSISSVLTKSLANSINSAPKPNSIINSNKNLKSIQKDKTIHSLNISKLKTGPFKDYYIINIDTIGHKYSEKVFTEWLKEVKEKGILREPRLSIEIDRIRGRVTRDKYYCKNRKRLTIESINYQKNQTSFRKINCIDAFHQIKGVE